MGQNFPDPDLDHNPDKFFLCNRGINDVKLLFSNQGSVERIAQIAS